MNQPKWTYRPMSPRVIDDVGPWTWYVPRLWAAVADPEGAARPIPRPRTQQASDQGYDPIAARVAYWTPLLDLTFGGLGWVRPDLGVKRWIELGLPTEDARLSILKRWWGVNAWWLTDADWDISKIANQVAELTGTPCPPWKIEREGRGFDPPTKLPRELGPNGLHLDPHVPFHLLGPCTEVEDVEKKRIVHGPSGQVSPVAVLLLDRYDGWYRALAKAGSRLPERPDGRSWRVDVVVRPMGWLGTYRRSRLTGRWFAGQHRWHVLGWP